MQIVDGEIQDWNSLDSSTESLLDWGDMLNESDYVCTLMFDHNKAPSLETYYIFHKYYRGRSKGTTSTKTSRGR